MEIRNSVAIVTGGASGLGMATAAMLANHDARVAIFDLDEVNGKAVAAATGSIFQSVDIADEGSVSNAMEEVRATFGTANILVNCAGIAPAARTIDRDNQPHPLATFSKTIHVNLIGTFNMISRFAALLSKEKEIDGECGVIVNTASIAAYDGQIGQAAYSASKGGIVGLTLPVARDLAQHKIRVMTIAPGIFLTPMVQSFPEYVQVALSKQVPHPNRLGNPAEFALLVEAIIRNPMLNGEIIRLDGAIRMTMR